MASEVDICNLALGHIGDVANVSSMSEASVQAGHCNRFYALARDSMLEAYTWNFATKYASLAALVNDRQDWDHSYAMPSDALRIIEVLPPGDYAAASQSNSNYLSSATTENNYSQPYTVEINSAQAKAIYTDQESAAARYVCYVTDTTKFTPLFTMALSWHLASMLAGPIIKGDVGAAEAKRCQQMMQFYLSKATGADFSQRNVEATQNVGWISGR